MPPLGLLGLLSVAGELVVGVELAGELSAAGLEVVGVLVVGAEVVGAVVLQAGSVLSRATPDAVVEVQLEGADPVPAVLLLLPPMAPCRAASVCPKASFMCNMSRGVCGAC